MVCLSQDGLLTVRDLAKLLKVSVRNVWRMRASGRIPPPLKIGGSVRFDRQDIEDWLQGLKGGRGGV